MTSVSAAALSLQGLAEPRQPGEKIKVLIARAAKRAGLEYWRAYDIWYAKAWRVEPGEVEAIEAALIERDREAARNELHELRIRMERIEAMLAANDPDFARPTLARIGERLRRMGGTDGALARSGNQTAIGSKLR